MATTQVVWRDKVKCPSCGAENGNRDEWCESCLADIPSARANQMFVRRWTQQSRTDRG
jgi:hypothetical protein